MFADVDDYENSAGSKVLDYYPALDPAKRLARARTDAENVAQRI